MGMLNKVLAPFIEREVKNRLSEYGTLEDAQFWTKLSVNHPYPGAGNFMRVMAALRAGMVIAQGIGQMPLHVRKTEVIDNKVYRRNAVDERSYRLLNRRPNSWMTSIEWREAMTLIAVFRGVARSLVVRAPSDGRPLEILPLHPTWVTAGFNPQTGQYEYKVAVNEYGISGVFTRDDIIEISNPRWDFVSGLDVTRYASSVLGLAEDLEARQANMSKRNAPYGIISTEEGRSKESISKLKSAWEKQFGSGHGIAIIDFAAKFQQMMSSAQDQQQIENRKFQIEEVARAYGVFPQMLMASDTPTYASAESFFLAHWTHTISPWTERWEQGIDRALFDDSSDLSANFDKKVLLTTDLKSRADYLSRALGSGGGKPWMTQNEARAWEELDPHPDGDDLDAVGAAKTPTEVDDGTQITDA